MRQGDPGVVRIPNDRRNRAESENEQEQIKIGPPKFPTQSRQEEDKNDRDQLERVGELAEKSEADEEPGERPPPGKERAAFERKPEAVERRYPEENRERIDRQDEAAEIEDRRDIQRDHRPETGQRAEQALGEIIKKQARAGGEQRTPKAHPKLVVAKDRGARPNDESDPGPLLK